MLNDGKKEIKRDKREEREGYERVEGGKRDEEEMGENGRRMRILKCKFEGTDI